MANTSCVMHVHTFGNAHFKFSSRQDVAINAFILLSLDILSSLILPEKESAEQKPLLLVTVSILRLAKQRPSAQVKKSCKLIRNRHLQGGFGSQLEQCAIAVQANEARGAM